MSGLNVRAADLPRELPAIDALCWAYRALLITRTTHVPDMVETYYSKAAYSSLLRDLPRIHARPKGDILVADLNGAIVGCAMYYQHPTGDCEIKRVMVSDAARGAGAGTALMRGAMARAKADGHTRMMLDTVHTLVEAIGLYERVGFAPCAPFYDPDPKYAETLRFFDVQL